MAAVTICSDFGAPPKIKSVTVSIASPSICHEVMGHSFLVTAIILPQIYSSKQPTHVMQSFLRSEVLKSRFWRTELLTGGFRRESFLAFSSFQRPSAFCVLCLPSLI